MCVSTVKPAAVRERPQRQPFALSTGALPSPLAVPSMRVPLSGGVSDGQSAHGLFRWAGDGQSLAVVDLLNVTQ